MEVNEEQEEALHEHYRFVADKGQELLRIDKFLMDRLPNTSRNKIQQAAVSGNIRVFDKIVKSNYKVRPEDIVTVVLPYPPRELKLIPEEMDLNLLYEDDDVIVLNKPSDMVVHPGYGNYTGTLVNGLVHHFNGFPDTDEGGLRPGLVHRLDKHTTGVMVVAKTELALTHLADQFFHRTVERRYHALVWGNVKEDEGTVEGNIGRSLKNRKMMTVFPEADFGKHAVTHYKVLRRYDYVTLVECKLETGRTHQIRVHMKHIGHTLFNDLEYGGDQVLKGTVFAKYKQFVLNTFQLLDGQALHAKSLGFVHPVTKEWKHFDSNYTVDFQGVLDRWENYTSNRNS